MIWRKIRKLSTADLRFKSPICLVPKLILPTTTHCFPRHQKTGLTASCLCTQMSARLLLCEGFCLKANCTIPEEEGCMKIFVISPCGVRRNNSSIHYSQLPCNILILNTSELPCSILSIFIEY